MDQSIARLRIHQRNIDRYNNMLKTRLTATERQFVERRLSEERFAIAMLEFMSPQTAIKRVSIRLMLAAMTAKPEISNITQTSIRPAAQGILRVVRLYKRH